MSDIDEEFDQTTTALEFTPPAGTAETAADQLEQSIIIDLENYDYPITAAFIARHINTSKSNVNKKLYRMKNTGTVEQLECLPPLWRLL